MFQLLARNHPAILQVNCDVSICLQGRSGTGKTLVLVNRMERIYQDEFQGDLLRG